MSTTTKLGDEFLCIPKLDVAGTNWVIYKDRFLWSIDACGILNHLDGSGQEPADPIPDSIRVSRELSDAQVLLDAEWKKEMKEWKQGEAIAKQQIASSIPDSLFMKIRAKGTAREIWKALRNHFQNKSCMVSVDLRRRLQDQRCLEKGDVAAHFATLRTMHKDLAAMGHPPSEDDFYAIILGSLPPSFDPYISAVNATSSVLGTSLSADDLMLTITEEYERRILKSKSGKKDENVAFYSNDSGKGRKGGSSSKKNVECFNCKKKGHYKADCWAEGGGKAGQGPKGKGNSKGKEKETAATAKEKEKEIEEAWMVSIDDVSEKDVEEGSEDSFGWVDELFEDNQCFSNCEEDPNLDLPSLIPNSDSDCSDDEDNLFIGDLPLIPLHDEAYSSFDTAALVSVRSTNVDLYNSGATRHMSGFRHRFINFVEIEPKLITAADE
jgi:hypothetical protein